VDNGNGIPSDWVKRFTHLVPDEGTVLDVAAGSGRHSAHFLALGHPVTAIDRNTDALARMAADASKMEVITADLEDGSLWPLGSRKFAAVVVCNYLYRPIFPKLSESISPGGVLLYDTFAAGNEKYGRPSNPNFLLQEGELLAHFGTEFQIIAYEFGKIDGARPSVRQRFCGIRKPLEPRSLPALSAPSGGQPD
jgi:SAM-dependent methyltransferase